MIGKHIGTTLQDCPTPGCWGQLHPKDGTCIKCGPRYVPPPSWFGKPDKKEESNG